MAIASRRPRNGRPSIDQPTTRPRRYRDARALADDLVDEIGKEIVLGLPLGLGKANHLVNALVDKALDDSSISLRIFTALILEKPQPSNALERRFIEPVIERLFGGYPELAYAKALRGGTLPDNIIVNEFFFAAGAWMSNQTAQRSYISANYTHVAGYLIDAGVNVIAQLVAADGAASKRKHYSLSCNPDITLDLLAAMDAGRADFRLIGQTNGELPFMPGDAALPASAFSQILDDPAFDFPLFAPPKAPVSAADYAIGLSAAALVPDGGTLQIGIGSIGDAVTQALILRHRSNDAFREALGTLGCPVDDLDTRPFDRGLYGLSEMFVDGFLHLAETGILKREVDGACLHAGFFLGPRSFYAALRDMPEERRARIQMTAISFVNELYGEEAAKRGAMVDARFINNAMMATLLGATISDGLEDGRVVSGVGGQYNFAAQAFALDGARSIMTLNATRKKDGKTVSNILWSYGHETIPRHLRDLVVTEYGIADLCGKSDEEVVKAMLDVADSRFQEALLDQAKSAGKIESGYELPAASCRNTPDRLAEALAELDAAGHIPPFPFGTDFTPIEQRLMPALKCLKQNAGSPWRMASLLINHGGGAKDERHLACRDRMGLATPAGWKEWFYDKLLSAALRATERPD
jgi:acyl-CoA hydrolase